nr:hypothetical protein [Candidatus Sigynarchaeota archaeon]
MTNQKTAFVRVAEAKPRDVGRNIIRIDPQIASSLDIRTGDAVEIVGKRKTAALAWPGYPEDAG